RARTSRCWGKLSTIATGAQIANPIHGEPPKPKAAAANIRSALIIGASPCAAIARSKSVGLGVAHFVFGNCLSHHGVFTRYGRQGTRTRSKCHRVDRRTSTPGERKCDKGDGHRDEQ